MSQASNDKHLINPDVLQFSLEQDAAGQPAWTEIEEGRFMPRRVRGSCQGRVLG